MTPQIPKNNIANSTREKGNVNAGLPYLETGAAFGALLTRHNAERCDTRGQSPQEETLFTPTIGMFA